MERKEKSKGESDKMRKRPFFFLFTFQNHWNLFCVFLNGNFLTGKSISRRGKKSGKMTLPPLKNIPLTPLGIAMWNWIYHTYLCDLILRLLFIIVKKTLKGLLKLFFDGVCDPSSETPIHIFFFFFFFFFFLRMGSSKIFFGPKWQLEKKKKDDWKKKKKKKKKTVNNIWQMLLRQTLIFVGLIYLKQQQKYSFMNHLSVIVIIIYTIKTTSWIIYVYISLISYSQPYMNVINSIKQSFYNKFSWRKQCKIFTLLIFKCCFHQVAL